MVPIGDKNRLQAKGEEEEVKMRGQNIEFHNRVVQKQMLHDGICGKENITQGRHLSRQREDTFLYQD